MKTMTWVVVGITGFGSIRQVGRWIGVAVLVLLLSQVSFAGQVFYGFEDDAIGSLPNGWFANVGGPSPCVTNTDARTGAKSLILSAPYSYDVGFNLPELTSHGSVDCYVKFDQSSKDSLSWCVCLCTNANGAGLGGNVVGFAPHPYGANWYGTWNYGQSIFDSGVPAVTGVYNHIRIEWDCRGGTDYLRWIWNDSKVVDSSVLGNADGFRSIHFYQNGQAPTGAEMFLDDVIFDDDLYDYRAMFDADLQGWGPCAWPWMWCDLWGCPTSGCLVAAYPSYQTNAFTNVFTNSIVLDAGGKRTVEASFYCADTYGRGSTFTQEITLKFSDGTEAVRIVSSAQLGIYCGGGWSQYKAIFHEAKNIQQIKNMKMICYTGDGSKIGANHCLGWDGYCVRASDWPVLAVVGPGIISPNGDGIYDTQTINVYPPHDMTFALDILDSNQAVVATLAQNQAITQPTNCAWNGLNGNQPFTNGNYVARLAAPGVNAFAPLDINTISNWPHGFSDTHFFPIGVYGLATATNSADWNTHFSMLSNAGFNTVHIGFPAQAGTLLDCAANHGMKVIFQSRMMDYCWRGAQDPLDVVGSKESDVRNVAIQERDAWGAYSALLGWDIMEEECMTQIPNWVLCHRVKAGVDPNHPVLSVQSPSSNFFSAITGQTDLAVGYFDIYPVAPGTPTNANLTYYTDLLDPVIAAIGNRPVWTMLQAFGDGGSSRLPTAAELRGMTYLALASGAKGIFYFVYAQDGMIDAEGNRTPVGDAAFALAGELKTLAPTLLALTKTSLLTPEPTDYRVGYFLDETNPVMIVASKRPDANQIAQIPVTGTHAWKDVLDNTGYGPSNDKLSVPLATGAGRVLVLKAPPQASLSSPTNNSVIVTNAMTLTANASDDVCVARVDFYSGTTRLSNTNWLDGYANRQKLTVTNLAAIGSNLTNFPLLIKFTAANFDFAAASTDGHDLRFTAGDGTTTLSFDRERHDAVNEVAEYWVKVPVLSSGMTTALYVYYGSLSAVGDGANPTNVWGDYLFVHHLGQAVNGCAWDATVNAVTGRLNGVTLGVPGCIDGAGQFTDGNFIGLAAFPTPTSATLEAWLNTDSLYGGNSADGNYVLFLNSTAQLESCVCTSAGVVMNMGASVLAPGTWHYVADIYGDQGRKLYVDGALDSANTNTGIPSNSVWQAPQIGGLFVGMLDEVRMSKTVRSAVWVKAQYTSMRDQLLQYGAVEQPTATSVVWSSVASGSYVLTVVVYDNCGMCTTSTVVNITVNDVPTATLIVPANGAVWTAPASIALTATVANTVGTITNVSFYGNGMLLTALANPMPPYRYVWASPPLGTNVLTAKAWDSYGAMGISSAATNIINDIPICALTSPTTGVAYLLPTSITWTATVANTIGAITNVSFCTNEAFCATGRTVSATVFTNVWKPVTGRYVLTGKAWDSYGVVGTSLTNTILVWTNQDIGVVVKTGSATYTNPTYRVAGAGADIETNKDAFRFVYLPLPGSNYTVMARVATMSNPNVWAKAGVMIRKSLATNAVNALVAVTPTTANGVTWQYRASDGGNTTHANTTGITTQRWVKLVRSGNSFSAYQSVTNTSWTQIGTTVSLPNMGTNAYVGLAVTSHTTSSLCTGAFDNVSITLP